MIKLIEHPSSSYSPRTYLNVHKSDATVAIAIDFATLGEICTKNATIRMGKPYLNLDYENPKNTNYIIKFCRKHKVKILNIAGNGLYTFRKLNPKDWGQDGLNKELKLILHHILIRCPKIKIVAGGQTGIDWAAVIACSVLGIDCEATFPKRFKQRNAFGVDFYQTEEDVWRRIERETKMLKNEK